MVAEPEAGTHATVWRENGLVHREDDLPAVELANGRQEWWHRGVRHRVHGPAIVGGGSDAEYFVEGSPVSDPDGLLALESEQTVRAVLALRPAVVTTDILDAVRAARHS
jgi:hypothetical protein